MTYHYTVQSTERQADILLLTLAPLGNPLQFTPGQYAVISFRQNGRPTPARCFSMVNTPGSKTLQFAMRVKGRFTSTAAGLAVGSAVEVQGPFGDFTVNPDYDRRVVMLAGGIGITPFLSIIRDATERQSRIPITLLFSNRHSANVPFAAALKTLAQRNPYFQVRLFAGNTTDPITSEHLRQYTSADQGDTTYFICGPKRFTQAMQRMLARSDVHASRIITESFAQSSGVTLGSGWSVPSLTYSLSAATFALAVVAIMALDLTRAVPKLAQAQAKSTTESATQTQNKATTTPASTSDNTTTASPTTTQSTPATSTPNQAYYYYQPPVSRVS